MKLYIGGTWPHLQYALEEENGSKLFNSLYSPSCFTKEVRKIKAVEKIIKRLEYLLIWREGKLSKRKEMMADKILDKYKKGDYVGDWR